MEIEGFEGLILWDIREYGDKRHENGLESFICRIANAIHVDIEIQLVEIWKIMEITQRITTLSSIIVNEEMKGKQNPYLSHFGSRGA